MKILSIGIFHLNGDIETIASDSSLLGKCAALKTENIIKRFNAENHETHLIYAVEVRHIFYYLQSNGQFLYILSSDEAMTLGEIEKHFVQITEIALTKEYDELGEKINDPSYVSSKIKKIRRDLDITTQVLLKNVDKVLLRGEKIENLMARTEALTEASSSFETQAFKTYRKRQSPWDKVLNCLRFFACCGNKRQKKENVSARNKRYGIN